MATDRDHMFLADAARLAGVIACAVCVACGLPGVASPSAATEIDIAKNGLGVPPADFELARTGKGSAAKWVTVRDVTAAAGIALEQASTDPAENRYPLAIYRPASLKNVDVSVRLKLIAGATASAGIAVRLVTSANYYVVSINALEGRVDLFRVIDGTRERIAGTEIDVARDHWQALRIVVEDDRFTVSIDEQLLFNAWDHSILRHGHVALWTEEGTVARFDRIAIESLPASEQR